MSGASSGDDSELEPEVPTEVPSDVEVHAASGGTPPGSLARSDALFKEPRSCYMCSSARATSTWS